MEEREGVEAAVEARGWPWLAVEQSGWSNAGAIRSSCDLWTSIVSHLHKDVDPVTAVPGIGKQGQARVWVYTAHAVTVPRATMRWEQRGTMRWEQRGTQRGYVPEL